MAFLAASICPKLANLRLDIAQLVELANLRLDIANLELTLLFDVTSIPIHLNMSVATLTPSFMACLAFPFFFPEQAALTH